MSHRVGRRALLAAFTVLISQLSASAAIVGASFSLSLAASDRLLSAQGTAFEQQVLMEESCDNPHLRIRARNKPALMLSNTSGGGAQIESFTLNITEGDYLFGTGDSAMDHYNQYIRESIYSTDGVSITGSSVSADGMTLTVNFSDFTPGKKVLFNVDLDADDMDMFPFPDYRSVLHGAPMAFGEQPSLPATVSVLFTEEATAESMAIDATLPQFTEVPTYANERIRPYHSMDMMEVTEIGGQVIPEPSALLLGALSALGAVTSRRRR